MNREILFRGKRIDNGEWVYGYLFIDITGSRYIRVNTEKLGRYNDYQVYTKTIGQFTGITDENSERIFEGDIVEMTWNVGCKDEHRDVGIVRCDDAPYEFDLHGCSESTNDRFKYKHGRGLIIIGNIHDNEELLNE